MALSAYNAKKLEEMLLHLDASPPVQVPADAAEAAPEERNTEAAAALEDAAEGNTVERRLERTTDVVSKFAYLIGVRKKVFENQYEAPQLQWYEQLEKDKRARIIRNLCVLRNSIELNFGKINRELRSRYRTIYSMKEYIPPDSVMQLTADGITVFRKSNTHLGQHIIEINRLIGDRINNCKELFPTWLNWDYLRDLFIMPNGLTEDGIKSAANEFFSHLECYPYRVYMNWVPYDCGNILSSDKKFVSLLYEWNHDHFVQYNKVEDVSDYVTGNIYDFIRDGNRISFFVDCENSDPYNLYAALAGLDRTYTEKITSIILFDDVHTSTAWKVLEDHLTVPVEHILIDRVKENKSLVDINLAMRASREYYQNQADSFVIVSSDSDYWGVITNLTDARFLVMVEHGKCGPDIRAALDEKGIFYCYIDEFHSARSEAIQKDAVFREMLRYLQEHLNFNFNDMLDSALTATRANMTADERRRFFERYVRTFQAAMDKDGNLQITLKR